MGLVVTSGARYLVDTADVNVALNAVNNVIAGTATAEESALVTDLGETGSEVTGEQ
jgi:hypothetical protein